MPSYLRPDQKPAGTMIFRSNAWLHHLVIVLTLLTALGTLFVSADAAGELDALLLLLATIASVSALARQLPLQSVLFAAFITALIGTAAHGLSERTGIPLGPLSFGESVGPQLFN